MVNSIKLETGSRPNSAGIPYTLLLRIEAMGFPTFGLLLYVFRGPGHLLGCLCSAEAITRFVQNAGA